MLSTGTHGTLSRPLALACRNSSETSSTHSWNAASWRTACCADCGHDGLVAFSCKRRGFCPSCGARRISQSAAHLVDNVIPRVPVRRQWVLSLPIPLRLLLAAQPVLVTPVLQVVHRVITRHLLEQTGLKAFEADSGAVTLIQRFGSASQPQHKPALPGAGRRVPAQGRLAGIRPGRFPHR